MNVRLQRTVLNWKWWLLLPAIPIFFLIILLHMALDTSRESIDELIDWSRKP